jgi:uncharacterized protein (TIGR02996 family)
VTDRHKFLEQIRDAPDDDTLRLVYADWLDEHRLRPDDPVRAELIRLQVALTRSARLDNGRDLDERRIQWRCDTLVEQLGTLGDYPPLLGVDAVFKTHRGVIGSIDAEYESSGPSISNPGFRYDRGFIHAINVTRFQFENVLLPAALTSTESLFARHPAVTEIVLHDRSPLQLGPLQLNTMWVWFEGDFYYDRHHVGELIGSRLSNWTAVTDLNRLRGYPTALTAHRALSAACVALVRATVPIEE